MADKILTKSRYLYGLQCPKLLWVAVNEPEHIPEVDAATQHRFDQGHLAGELAQKLFPGGVTVPADDFMANITLTRRYARERVPLFEAGVMKGRIYSRADILNPVGDEEWDIIEVKSAASVKKENYDDVAFQKLCWEEAGAYIRKCYLMYINKEYVRSGEIDPSQLFIMEDISDEVAKASEGIEDRIEKMLEFIDNDNCPLSEIGPQCDDPYTCSLKDECWNSLPEHNIFTLYKGGKKNYELYRKGIVSVLEIPADYELNQQQLIQLQSVASGKPHIEKRSIREFLSHLEYPLYFFDFETFDTAIPLFNGTRPYQKIPFQYSLHVQTGPGAKPEHYFYLAEGEKDPRPGLLEELRKVIKEKGSILAYNIAFESSVLKKLGEDFPEYVDLTENMVGRLVDLIIPFRNFHYYHPSQKGSASLKNVLPALTGISYDSMPIGEGGEASVAYLDMIFGNKTEEEVAQIRQNLLDYCKLDTEGMVRIVEALRDITT